MVEVEISPRRNKMGKRFDFARFVNVEDGRMLAVSMDKIIIDGKKIHVKLPRFGRNRRTTFEENTKEVQTEGAQRG